MSEDRLEEIKSYGKSTVYGKALVTDDDIEWLISELEQSRAAMAEVRRLWEKTLDRADKAEAEAENAKGACSAKGACMKAALNQLKIRTQELKECKAEVDTLSIAIAGVGGAFEKQRRHRKWALKELKVKQALWRNYCGEVSELMNEVKRLKAMLAIGHFVIRE